VHPCLDPSLILSDARDALTRERRVGGSFFVILGEGLCFLDFLWGAIRWPRITRTTTLPPCCHPVLVACAPVAGATRGGTRWSHPWRARLACERMRASADRGPHQIAARWWSGCNCWDNLPAEAYRCDPVALQKISRKIFLILLIAPKKGAKVGQQARNWSIKIFGNYLKKNLKKCYFFSRFYKDFIKS
jgi:hypothetical protein